MTALRVCVLRGWRGKSVLCATDASELHTEHTYASAADTHAESEPDTPASLTMAHVADDGDGSVQVEPDISVDQSAVRTKRSKVIDYQVSRCYRFPWVDTITVRVT